MNKRQAFLVFGFGALTALAGHSAARAAIDAVSVLTGPRGAAGAAGATGATGEQGLEGPPGLPIYTGANGVVVSGTEVRLAPQITVTDSAITFSAPIGAVDIASLPAAYTNATAVQMPFYQVSTINTTTYPLIATCVGTDIAVGGGCYISPSSPNCFSSKSYPKIDGHGWECINTGPSACLGTTVAICLKTP